MIEQTLTRWGKSRFWKVEKEEILAAKHAISKDPCAV
jgi:hypothetical protein